MFYYLYVYVCIHTSICMPIQVYVANQFSFCSPLSIEQGK